MLSSALCLRANGIKSAAQQHASRGQTDAPCSRVTRSVRVQEMRCPFGPICLLLVGCGSRSGLNAAVEEADASPPPSCPGSPDQPLMLATVGEFAKYDKVTAMTVANGFVYYAVNDGSNNPVAIFRVPTSGGTSSAVIQGQGGCDVSSPFAYGGLETDGRYLFTPDEEAVGCTGYSARVTAYDTTNGALFQLPIPPGADAEPRAVSPRALAGGGVVWAIDPGTYTGPIVVARWTGGPTSTLVATLSEWATGFVVAGGVGFVSTIATGTVTLDQVSLTDGTVTPLGQFGTDFVLLGANDEAIFYTPEGKTFARREVVSGAVKSLGVPLPLHAMWVDHDYLYNDSIGVSPPSFPAVLTRIPATGGSAKQIFHDASRNGIQVHHRRRLQRLLGRRARLQPTAAAGALRATALTFVGQR